jgi:hypothetical protein
MASLAVNPKQSHTLVHQTLAQVTCCLILPESHNELVPISFQGVFVKTLARHTDEQHLTAHRHGHSHIDMGRGGKALTELLFLLLNFLKYFVYFYDLHQGQGGQGNDCDAHLLPRQAPGRVPTTITPYQSLVALTCVSPNLSFHMHTAGIFGSLTVATSSH